MQGLLQIALPSVVQDVFAIGWCQLCRVLFRVLFGVLFRLRMLLTRYKVQKRGTMRGGARQYNDLTF